MMANKEDTAIGSTAHQPETTPTLEASLSSNSTPNSTDKGHSDDAIRPNDGSAGPATVAAGQRAAQLGLSRAQLEQEVGQVMGNLNSWWGGVKKQSASALSSIKADLDKTVSQAQADLEYLRSAKVEIARKPEEEPKIPSATKGQETGEAEPPIADPATEGPSTELTHGSGLLDRLTTSTNQLQQTLQSTFQSTLASAAANPALSNPKQLRLQLAENLRLSSAKANLQLSVKQAEKMAEEYLRKGDQWVKDAEKWMGDAVKVLPPEDPTTRYVATSWDGGDFYAFTTSVAPADQVIFEADPRTPRPSSSAVLGASRKDILLSQLRQNKDLLMLNPESDSETVERRTEYRTWLENMWDAEKEAGKAREIGNVGDIRMALGKKQSLEVPELLTDEQFWQRYLFHIHMIEAEDEKRKKVLEATAQEVQDDFSWDDEPEDSPATHQTREVQPAPGPAVEAKKNTDTVVKRPTNPTNVSTATSPRDSEESYDVVSDQGVKELARKEEKTKPASTEDEDEDSDWE